MATKQIDLGVFNISSNDRFQATITKDGSVWSGIDSVDLVFEKPDRSTQFTRSMLLEDDSTGKWYYDTVIGELDTVGWWTLGVRVVDGPVSKRYPYEIGFYVQDNP